MLKPVPVSILIATYAGEQASRLYLALESLYVQSRIPLEIVLVVDGPVDEHQEEVIQMFATKPQPPLMQIIRKQRCNGLAAALNYGLPYCSNEIIARMDSDDISRNDRMEKQYIFLLDHSDIDVVASWQAEFEDDDTEHIRTVKETPAKHEEIVRALRWRNVVSHPTIMFRKTPVVRIGGYNETVGLLEDYDLHMRLVHAGSRYAAIQEPLVKVRISRNQRSRRGGWSYILAEGKFRYRSFRRGNYSFAIFLFSFIASAVFRLMPVFLKAAMYRLVRNSVRVT